ncbi:MAG: peptidylprolyl isomerase [Allosphingosinicella sp.]|uniref:peptidylprolyl isomerase n=1 Tax=Allosphingosinicella sp. TaxID=2823234 RepID=UPI00392F154C
MRSKMLFAGLAGFLFAGALVAQAPAETIATPAPPPPAPALSAEDSWHLDLSTGGRVTVQLRPDVAPGHVERIKTLTRRGFYDGLVFHRVIEGFMAQGGDPTGTGEGGSDLPDLTAEFSQLPHLRGSVAMARAEDVNSANSQFYIMFAPRFSLDGRYTVFGRVVSGMNHVDALARGEPPLEPSRIVRASIGSDNVPPPPPVAAQPAPAQPAPEAQPQ